MTSEYYNHVISLTKFPQTQIQNDRWLLRFQIPQA